MNFNAFWLAGAFFFGFAASNESLLRSFVLSALFSFPLHRARRTLSSDARWSKACRAVGT